MSKKKFSLEFPLTSRKTLRRAKLAHEGDVAGLKCRIQWLEDELRDAKSFNKDVLPKLLKVNLFESKEYGTYRVCVDLHRRAVEDVFRHGADDQLIRYTARMLADAVEKKMVQFNFVRKDDL